MTPATATSDMSSFPSIHPSLRGLAHVAKHKIPFHKELGLELLHFEPGYVIARIPCRAALIGDPVRPSIHGGVISLLVDVVGGFAVASTTEDMRDRVSTIDLRTDFLRPGNTDLDLYGVGRSVRTGARIAVARMQIYSASSVPDESGPTTLQPIALGQASYHLHRFREANAT